MSPNLFVAMPHFQRSSGLVLHLLEPPEALEESMHPMDSREIFMQRLIKAILAFEPKYFHLTLNSLKNWRMARSRRRYFLPAPTRGLCPR